jgi:hypothetical protein
MNTSILTVVLTGALLAGQNGTPAWQTDYAKVQEQSAAQKKPLAVVFGSGVDGWAKVVRDNGSAEIGKLMAEKYLCVYVDTATPAGKKLAERFGINGSVGIVLGDREGTTQAFWHQGDLPGQTLTRLLQKYADPQTVVRTTETVTSRTSFYPSEIDLNGSSPFDSYCPSCNNGRSRR